MADPQYRFVTPPPNRPEPDPASEALVERLAEAMHHHDGLGYRARLVLPIITDLIAEKEREAVEKALGEVEAELDHRRRTTAPGRARMAWGDAVRIIAAARERGRS